MSTPVSPFRSDPTQLTTARYGSERRLILHFELKGCQVIAHPGIGPWSNCPDTRSRPRSKPSSHKRHQVFTMDIGTQLTRSHDIGIKIALILGKRTKKAQEQFNRRMQEAI